RSITSRSGRFSATAAIASAPSRAIVIVWPRASSALVTVRTTSASSSTTRIRPIARLLVDDRLDARLRDGSVPVAAVVEVHADAALAIDQEALRHRGRAHRGRPGSH